MTITRWDPIRDLALMQRWLDRTFDDTWFVPGGDMERMQIPLDLIERDGELEVRASVPGFKPDDIDVTVQGDLLTISGTHADEMNTEDGNFRVRERRMGSFQRSVRLPVPVDAEKCHAETKNGELVLLLPKRAEAVSRRIEVSH